VVSNELYYKLKLHLNRFYTTFKASYMLELCGKALNIFMQIYLPSIKLKSATDEKNSGHASD
jgi:hypothetical protein